MGGPHATGVVDQGVRASRNVLTRIDGAVVSVITRQGRSRLAAPIRALVILRAFVSVVTWDVDVLMRAATLCAAIGCTDVVVVAIENDGAGFTRTFRALVSL